MWSCASNRVCRNCKTALDKVTMICYTKFMKLMANKKHYHPCYECRGKTSCWYIHNKDGSDVVGTLCDACIRKILKQMEDLNV
jgi:hypothetical protein